MSIRANLFTMVRWARGKNLPVKTFLRELKTVCCLFFLFIKLSCKISRPLLLKTFGGGGFQRWRKIRNFGQKGCRDSEGYLPEVV